MAARVSEDPAPTASGDSALAGSGAGPRAHALRVLEFPRVLDLVARDATSELGAARVRELRPFERRAPAAEALAAVDEMVGLLHRDEGWAPPPIPDLRAALRRLGVDGSVLEPSDLAGVATLLDSARRVRRDILRFSEEWPGLARRAGRAVKAPQVQERLEASLDEAGAVADGASPELARLRRDLRGRRADLVSRLERLAGNLPSRVRVPDASVTLRNGRYCIPVRREGRSQVGGIVHDESASRQTLFVEPPQAIEPMNEIRELEMAEAREVRRILGELTDLVRPLREPLADSLEALAEIDSLFARATYAVGHGGVRPELGPDEERGAYRVAEGRHPLLLATGEPTVPFSLELAPGESTLLVSGPNAGGKTVLLKAIGVISAMAQSGLPPPVGPGTRLPTFDGFFAVIGDEQSIEASLSTFSAQVANLKEIVDGAGGRSLVLVDEIGGNTDPSEGAALAAAVLLRLARQAGLTVATTHLGDLKALAGEDDRVVNASLQFDRERLRPTFALLRDRPGRSYALEIAGRLGLPEDVLAEARRRTSTEGRALESVLAELEGAEEELQGMIAAARGRQRELERRARELEEREERSKRRARDLESREAELEREARQRAETYLLEARERVEEAIRRLEERYAETPRPRASARVESETREAAAAARRAVEEAVRETRDATPEMPLAEPELDPEALEEGQMVHLRSLGRAGRVREVRGERVVVTAGGLRLTVPISDLERAPDEEVAGEAGRGDRGGGPTAVEARPEIEPRSEVDLRGLRADEVEAALVPALDAAIFADLPRLRIIHGKGTGALRRRVREVLGEDARIAGFRAGAFDEGGSGVTVVEFDRA